MLFCSCLIVFTTAPEGECNNKIRAPFGDPLHVHSPVCTVCGAEKDTMQLKTLRWISQFKWWNPKTWAKGHWQERED